MGTSTGPATSLAAESLLSLAVTVTSEPHVESVLRNIVQGLAAQPGVALTRIWLLPSAELPGVCPELSDPPDYLRLVASAGTPIHSPGEDWSFLEGHFARVPFNVGKVGQVAASWHPILVEDVTAQNDWVVRPGWAKREEIRSFVGHPLIFRDKLLGVIAVFSRQSLGQRESTWLGLFANQAALAIANACAEEALQSSERNLTAIINTIPTAAWTTRPDGYCDFLNRVWLDYAGITAEQAAGWGWAEAIHPDDRAKLVEEWQSCLASGTPVDTEARIRRFDSSYRWFLIRGNPLKNQEGKLLKWYGTCVDIEDRKRREDVLRARELSWREIVDNIPGLVATTGAMGEVEFLNRQTLEYFGRTSEELKSWALINAVHPDDLPRAIEVRKKSIETGEIYEVEHRCRRADGVYRWFQVRGLPVRVKGAITDWYLLLTDIDDRKKAEEALHSRERDLSLIINTMPTLAWSARPDGAVDFLNQRWLAYTGLSPEQGLGWGWAAAIHPEDLKRIAEYWQAILQTGEPGEIEVRFRRFDGEYRWFLFRGNAIRDESGNIVKWYGTNTDIDDRKKAEEALQASERNLSLMIDVIPTFVHVLRDDGSVLYANQAVLDYTGLTLEDVKKEDYRARVFHPEDVERLLEGRREALTRPVPFENEQRALGKDGIYRWFLVRYNPWVEEGRVKRWYVTSTEIESRKQEEERVRQENVRLEERTRIARELHDTLLQTFFATSLQLATVVNKLPPDSPVKPKFESILELMEHGMEEGRNAIQGLRSPGSNPLGLVEALSAVRQEFSTQSSVDFRVRVVGQQQPLRLEIYEEVFHLGREALVNAFLHSGAKCIDLELDYGDRKLTIRIRDNGCGIDPQVLNAGREGHWGLTGMRERATRIGGLLNISSCATTGTEIKLSIPSDVAFQSSPPNPGRMKAGS